MSRLNRVHWILLPAALVFAAPARAQEEGAEPAPPADSAPPPEAEPMMATPTPEDAPPPEQAPEPAAAAAPAPKDATVLDTIEVTASKRVKSQRDIPGSVGAIRGEHLERIAAQGMADYLKLIPGVTLADYGTGQQIPVIRGIASSTENPGVQFTGQTTGIYLEDMPFNDLYAPLSIPDLNPFDLERVEVLKGPQGTLFGSSALAGAIRYIVQKPNLGVWQGKVSTTVSQTRFAESPSSTHAGALNIPLGNDAAFRVVGLYRDEAGLYDSHANGGNSREEADVDRLKQVTGRALARWDVTPELKVSALYFQQETDQHDLGSANNPEEPGRNDVPFPSPSSSTFGGANLTATYDFPVGRLLYTGNLLNKDSYVKSQLERALPEQLGNQEDTSWNSIITSDIRGYTHELRFGSSEAGGGDWEWLAGVAFMEYGQEFFQFTPNPGPADSGYYANPPEEPEDVAEEDRAGSFLWATIDGVGTEKSVFGDITRRMGEHWEASVGARLFDTELIADSVITGAQIVALSNPPTTENRTHHVAKDRGLNPKFSLRYLHDRNIQVYWLASRGFQFGGFQLNPPVANIEQAAEDKGFHFGPYKSSALWNYEMGLRTEWLERRLRFDLSAFYIDWKNLQLTIQVPVNPESIPPGTGLPEDVSLDVIVNVARAHSEGLEAALEVAVFDGATFSSSVAWISALTDEPFDQENPDGPVPPGTRLPSTPRFQSANVVSYENTLPYFSSWTGGIALTHSHIGLAPDNIRKVRTVGGYDTLDARINLLRPGIAWMPELTLGIVNLTDVRGVAAYGGDGSVQQAFNFTRPRTAILNLAWKY